MVHDDNDPFGPAQAPGISLIMQFRIYDALMALLTHFDEETAEALLDMHAKGATLGSAPQFTGAFLYDELASVTLSDAQEDPSNE